MFEISLELVYGDDTKLSIHKFINLIVKILILKIINYNYSMKI
jgi:hypothetical protein